MADTELEEKWGGGGGEWGQLFDQSKSPQSETWPCKPYAGNMMGGGGERVPLGPFPRSATAGAGNTHLWYSSEWSAGLNNYG